MSDGAIEAVLEEVKLGYLSSRYGGTRLSRNWQDELSLGEQQVLRLGLRGTCHGYHEGRGRRGARA